MGETELTAGWSEPLPAASIKVFAPRALERTGEFVE